MSEFVSSVFCNVLIGCFCALVLSWSAVGIQNIINERREEKHREERNIRDAEYHRARMKEYLDK